MQKSDYINMFRRQAGNSSDLPQDDNVIAASLSSACLCQTYIGTTVTETYTNQPNVSVFWFHGYKMSLTSAVLDPSWLRKERHYCVQHSRRQGDHFHCYRHRITREHPDCYVQRQW
jgi:hypothetical protein